MKRAMLFAMLLTFLCSICSAQSPAYFRYNSKSGLNCTEVYEVIQDHLGFIWTATDRGVFKYDGYRFRSYTTAQGLTDNTIFTITEDYKGRIWAMPFNGKLCYIENDTAYEYQYNDTLTKYLPGMRIARTLEVLQDGSVQIGFLGHGLVEVSREGILKRLDSPQRIQGIGRYYLAFENSSHHILMATVDGKTPETNYTFSPVLGNRRYDFKFSERPRREHIVGIKRKSGTWCFALRNELIEIDSTGNVDSTSLPKQPLCIYEDMERCLWLGFDEHGGARRYFKGESVHSENYEELYKEETVPSIIQDLSGGYWISTHSHGMLYVPSLGVRCWEVMTPEEDEIVSIVGADGGSVYVLWREYGLAKIDSNILYELPKSDQAVGAYRNLYWENIRHRLIIGASGRTICYNVPAKRYSLLCDFGSNCAIDWTGQTYLGMAWSLGKLQNEKSCTEFDNTGIRHRPEVLFVDCKDQLWMGGLDGLYQLQDTSLIPYKNANPVFGQRIVGIGELQDSTLVVATQSHGIAFLKNGVTRTLTQKDGLKCDLVVGIALDGANTVWVSAKDGLFSICFNEGASRIQDYPALNGLVGQGGRCYFSKETNELWLASGSRVIRVAPSILESNNDGPPIYIRRVVAGDSVISKSETTYLPYNRNFVSVEYVGLAYRLQGALHYRYRFGDNESEWKYTNQTQVDFAALAPGEYSFIVEGQNENGVWSKVPARFSFVIRPPYWRTWWFTLSVIAISLFLVGSFFLYRFRTIRRSDFLRERSLVFRQQALASQMNPHFVFNALNSIQSLVLNSEITKALDMFAAFASLLRKSLDHAGERHIPLSEEIKMLTLYFQLEAMRSGDSFRYEIEVDRHIIQEAIGVPAMLVQPIVENAIKHGLLKNIQGGSVNVRFILEEDGILCEVEDNGIGRKASSLVRKRATKHKGLQITTDRLKVLSQISKTEYYFEIIDKYSFSTQQAEGTLVKFTIPFVNL